jgi:hypothetical protein
VSECVDNRYYPQDESTKKVPLIGRPLRRLKDTGDCDCDDDCNSDGRMVASRLVDELIARLV